MEREVAVIFCDEKTKKVFEKLRDGTFEDKILFQFINRAIDDLKSNPSCGTFIPKRFIPKYYIRKYNINNLRKYNLPNAWRLLYFSDTNEVKIIAIILEWMDHKNYERRFGYG